MNSLSINYTLIYQFKIDHKYQVTKCGKVFNVKTGKQIKRCYNSGSIGYWIGKKFLVLNKKEKLLEKIPKENCPF